MVAEATQRKGISRYHCRNYLHKLSSSSSVENRLSPIVQRHCIALSSSIASSFDRLEWYLSSFWNPWSTHRNKPPAVYCMKEYCSSPFWMGILEWWRTADGIRIVDPGGNSITSWRSQSTRWPPRLGSKEPREVMEHQPLGRLPGSVCLNETVEGPKLKVEHVNTVAKLRRRRVPYQLKREVTCYES